MTPELRKAIETMVQKGNEIIAAYWLRNKYTHAEPNILHITILSKWCRIDKMEHCKTDNKSESEWRADYPKSYFKTQNGNLYKTSSVYAFVALCDFSTSSLGHICYGDIHKAASYKAPAKHARGNVFNNIECLEPHGIAYL